MMLLVDWTDHFMARSNENIIEEGIKYNIWFYIEIIVFYLVKLDWFEIVLLPFKFSLSGGFWLRIDHYTK